MSHCISVKYWCVHVCLEGGVVIVPVCTPKGYRLQYLLWSLKHTANTFSAVAIVPVSTPEGHTLQYFLTVL